MTESERDKYYRRKNQNHEDWMILGDAFAQSMIGIGIPMLGMFGLLFGLIPFIDLPFVSWVGIGVTLFLVMLKFWTFKVFDEW
ncbi:MAG: hypothetical protein ACW99G_04920 [Candidatus Thorarchaeota archaeon]|jgi:hypothetical protein